MPIMDRLKLTPDFPQGNKVFPLALSNSPPANKQHDWLDLFQHTGLHRWIAQVFCISGDTQHATSCMEVLPCKAVLRSTVCP